MYPLATHQVSQVSMVLRINKQTNKQTNQKKVQGTQDTNKYTNFVGSTTYKGLSEPSSCNIVMMLKIEFERVFLFFLPLLVGSLGQSRNCFFNPPLWEIIECQTLMITQMLNHGCLTQMLSFFSYLPTY